MATSQNGYEVLFKNETTGPLPRLRKWQVPGADRYFFARDGSAGFLLVHYALWYHQKVERLDLGVWDDWGWAVRWIRGQSSGYSNHASGTALDLNATRHPLAVPVAKTLTPAQVKAIHHRLDLYHGCIRWGGDYTIRVDAMHYEVNKPLTYCEHVARRLLDSPRGARILKANPGAKEVILS